MDVNEHMLIYSAPLVTTNFKLKPNEIVLYTHENVIIKKTANTKY